jgi:mono/diheme cytochrome c family protein
VAAVVAASAAAQPSIPSATGSGWRDGAHVYANVCAHCHESGVAPVIRGRNLPPILITTFVRRGSRAMPAFRAAEIDDVALEQLAEFVAGRKP